MTIHAPAHHPARRLPALRAAGSFPEPAHLVRAYLERPEYGRLTPLLAPMPVLHINEHQYPLSPGTTRLGAPGAAEVPVAAGPGVQAIVEVTGPGVTIRRAGTGTAVRVNGVTLGAEPTPLLHGDRIEIAGVELRYADDRKAGATQFMTAADVPGSAARRSGPVTTSSTGGRLVSLVDGKEYAVPVTGLVIGREVGADVVVPLAEVSRRHAEIVPTAEGYRLTDLSTNGVLVNGERVTQSRLLQRSDVIRVGSEEFRFYADVARSAPPPGVVTIPPASRAAETVETAAPQRAPAAEAPREAAGSPLTAEPSRSAAPAHRPIARPAPAPTADGRIPLWMWLLLLLVIAAVAFFVMA